MASPEADYANAASRIIQGQGQAAAASRRDRGQLIGQTIASLGQLPLVYRELEAKRADQKIRQQQEQRLEQAAQFEQQKYQRETATESGVGAALSMLKPDGTFDWAKIHASLVGNPEAGPIMTRLRELDEDREETSLRLYKLRLEADELEAAHTAADGRRLQQLPPEYRLDAFRTILAKDVARKRITKEDAEAQERRLIEDPSYADTLIREKLAFGAEAKPVTPESFTLGPGMKRFGPNNEVVAEVPPNTPAAAAGGFSLSPGGRRFDAQGNEIASVPAAPPAPAAGGFTLPPGGVRYDAQGNVIASRPPNPPAAGAAAGGNEKVEAIVPTLQEINTLAQKIFTASGPMANITGAVRSSAAAVNLDDDVKIYRSLVRGMTPMIARALGHTGVLTEPDVQRTEALFPQMGILGSDSESVAAEKMAQMTRLITGQLSESDKDAFRQNMGWKTGGSTVAPEAAKKTGKIGPYTWETE